MKNYLKNNISSKKLVSKFLPAAAMLVPLTVIPSSAHAQLTIAISATNNLNFGSIANGATGGTVTIPPVGARTRTGSVTLLPGAGFESPAQLSISGSTGVLIDVAVTNPIFTIDDGGGGGAPMNVGAFDINSGGSNISLTLPTNPFTVPMGATLTVNAGQLDGAYFGFYSIIANYQ